MFSFLLALVVDIAVFLAFPIVFVLHRLRRPKARWLEVWVRPSVVEIETPPTLLSRLLGAGMDARSTSLDRLRRFAAKAGADASVEGIVFVVPPLAAGWAACSGLRAIVASLEAAGKRTVVFLPRGGGHREMYVASASSRVVTTPRSTLHLPGIGVSSLYVKPILDRLGIELTRFRRSDYKTAYESAELDGMSAPQREQLTALVTAIDGELRAALTTKLGDPARVEALFHEALVSAERARELGLLSDLAYEDELTSLVGLDPKKERLTGGGAYLAWHEWKPFRPLRKKPVVGVVDVRGAIVDQGAPGRDMPAIIGALRRAAKAPEVAGVVLRVSSPGGSALASDLIHREVVALRRKKPVVAFFDEVAASGGYYVGAACEAIVARPLTITGSIGVILARPSFAGLLAKLGVKREAIATSESADLLSVTSVLSDHERAILEREVDTFYRAFVGIVAEGRKRPYEEVEPFARGRVWIAQDAHAKGLVDRLGGFEDAIAEVERRVAERTGKRMTLEPVPVRLRAGVPIPPEPFVPGAAFHVAAGDASAVLDRLGVPPMLVDLARLASTGERVFYYEADIPDVR